MVGMRYSQIVEFMLATAPDRVVEVKVGAYQPQCLVGVIDKGSRSTVLCHTPLAYPSHAVKGRGILTIPSKRTLKTSPPPILDINMFMSASIHIRSMNLLCCQRNRHPIQLPLCFTTHNIQDSRRQINMRRHRTHLHSPRHSRSPNKHRNSNILIEPALLTRV